MSDMPDASENMVAQLLTNISKDVSDVRTDVAVIKDRTDRLPDLENRINRNTEDITVLKTQAAVGRDTWARVLAVVAVLAAGAASVADYLHH